MRMKSFMWVFFLVVSVMFAGNGTLSDSANQKSDKKNENAKAVVVKENETVFSKKDPLAKKVLGNGMVVMGDIDGDGNEDIIVFGIIPPLFGK